MLIALAVTFVAMLPGLWLVDRYYAATFSRIVGRPSPIAAWWLLGAVAVSAIVPGGPLGPGQMAVPFLIGAAAAFWIAVRDWPLRAHHLLGCAAVAFGAAIQLMSLQSDSLPRAQAIAFFALGVAYVPVGLLDHRLLTSVMRKPNGEAGVVRQE